MRRSLSALALTAAALTLGTGCASYVPFTQELRSEHDLQTGDLENLQFYNSHTITLRRELTRDSRRVTGNHTLLVIAGKQVEEVVIEEHTPGVVVGASSTALRVSFEEGTFLEFALRDTGRFDDPVAPAGGFAEPPNPFPGDSPVRLEPKRREQPLFGSGNFYLLPSGGRDVLFAGQTYEAIGSSVLAHLVISTESLEDVEEEETVLRGRKL